MPDRVVPGPVGNNTSIREAVSINTNKIFDCCRDKDCVDELRVYPTISSQTYLASVPRRRNCYTSTSTSSPSASTGAITP